MCWIGYTTNKKKATHNIKVYKILNVYTLDENVLMSPRQKFQYTLGQTYNAKIKPENNNCIDKNIIKVENGIHCYSLHCDFIRLKSNDVFVDIVGYHPSFKTGTIHSYRKNLYYFPMIFECIIPAGSTYYENEVGEIVTETLKINRLTDL